MVHVRKMAEQEFFSAGYNKKIIEILQKLELNMDDINQILATYIDADDGSINIEGINSITIDHLQEFASEKFRKFKNNPFYGDSEKVYTPQHVTVQQEVQNLAKSLPTRDTYGRKIQPTPMINSNDQNVRKRNLPRDSDFEPALKMARDDWGYDADEIAGQVSVPVILKKDGTWTMNPKTSGGGLVDNHFNNRIPPSAMKKPSWTRTKSEPRRPKSRSPIEIPSVSDKINKRLMGEKSPEAEDGEINEPDFHSNRERGRFSIKTPPPTRFNNPPPRSRPLYDSRPPPIHPPDRPHHAFKNYRNYSDGYYSHPKPYSVTTGYNPNFSQQNVNTGYRPRYDGNAIRPGPPRNRNFQPSPRFNSQPPQKNRVPENSYEEGMTYDQPMEFFG